MENNINNTENPLQTKNILKTEYVPYNEANRITERDGLSVQFFDKIKQTTNSFLQTIDIVDKKNKPVYGLYIEIYNPKDTYNVVCREVETEEVEINGKKQKQIVNNISYPARDENQNTYVIATNYAKIYQKAFANYKAMQQNKPKPYLTFAEQMNAKTIDHETLLSNYLTENNNSNNLI
jgi:GTPase involved in cell partitioning and DNA repair